MGKPEVIVDALRSTRRIGIDTPVVIYHIEQTSPRSAAASAILRVVADGHVQGVTSIVTLLEVTIQPLRLGRPEVADAYEALLGAIPNLLIADVDAEVARIAAELRAAYHLRTPDALQIAASLTHGAETFITNDRRLRRVTEIDVKLLDDFS